MKSFWKDLPTPFTILAPMEGVTDVVFRQIITKVGKPDVFFTEFTSCDGLFSIGGKKVAQSLRFYENEKPVVAQIWGSHPETFYQTAEFCKELGFSGIDINMGCPIKTVVKKGSCAALINNPILAGEIIQATKEGGGLPVSVKTRLGFENSEVDKWLVFLLEQDLAAISIHLRTAKELSKVPAHWESIPEILKLRNNIAPDTLIVGNGDIRTYSEIEEKFKRYKCEGYMVGRGIFTNPWFFNKSVKLENIATSDRLNLYIDHIQLFSSTWGGEKNSEGLKKFGKTYINNFDDASFIRDRVMNSKDIDEMLEIITTYRNSL